MNRLCKSAVSIAAIFFATASCRTISTRGTTLSANGGAWQSCGGIGDRVFTNPQSWIFNISWGPNGYTDSSTLNLWDGAGLLQTPCVSYSDPEQIPASGDIPGGTVTGTCTGQYKDKTYTVKLYKISAGKFGAVVGDGTQSIQELCNGGVDPAEQDECFSSIPKPAVAPTYDKDIKPIIQKNCGTNCHGGDTDAPSLTTMDDLKSAKKFIIQDLKGMAMPANLQRKTFCKSAEAQKLLQWLSYSPEAGN